MACHRVHPNLETLKQSLVRAVERFPQEVPRIRRSDTRFEIFGLQVTAGQEHVCVLYPTASKRHPLFDYVGMKISKERHYF
ncbi:unnamed protein product [Nezara viridula]|uniref:Uncharacterized protein n=1 Tax=Nezara viridula TaxID=85310 RepID=A0A9P0MUK9_NEZVI|nr:unnamed protein product [Nezara viridula]